MTCKEEQDYFCHALPTQPNPEMGTVLVTGASGYIGGQLVPELQARGYKVRVMVRAASSEHQQRWPTAEIVVADALNQNSLKQALAGVDVAYYLIHSLLLGASDFEKIDTKAASNFAAAANYNKLKRIIYLGGLGDQRDPLSPHLRSRIEVSEKLKAGGTPVTILRAAIIIGSGSASYEILKHLVKNSPVLPIPYWAKTRCQPISIRNVIMYLVGVLENEKIGGQSFDIGGPEILTYEKMLTVFAELLGKKRLFPPSPVSNLKFFAYIASLMTPVPAPITLCLMAGSINEVVCHNNDITRLIPFTTLTYREAIIKALSREEQDKIRTRWSDAYPPAHELAIKLCEVKHKVKFTTSYFINSPKPAACIFSSICRIGGNEGWFKANPLWRLRGMVDRIFMGVGTSRGRRSISSLRVNDVIDFWRVEELIENQKLLLRAEMKLPGKAWLEFRIEKEVNSNKLLINAYYQSKTLLGKLYWYAFLPFHAFIFYDLIKQIEKRS